MKRELVSNILWIVIGLELLQLRRWYRKLGRFYKIFKSKSPQYLFKLIPEKTSSYITRNTDNIPLFNTKHNFYRNFFFPLSGTNYIRTFAIQKNLVFSKIFLNLLDPYQTIFWTAAILKLVPVIFDKIFLSHQMITLQKLWKMFFYFI